MLLHNMQKQIKTKKISQMKETFAFMGDEKAMTGIEFYAILRTVFIVAQNKKLNVYGV